MQDKDLAMVIAAFVLSQCRVLFNPQSYSTSSQPDSEGCGVGEKGNGL